MEKKFIIGFVVGIAVLLGILIYVNNKNQPPTPNVNLDSFAMCLKDKGAIFYGAFWCPHCQATKRMFGNSKNLLPYVECSTADGQGQLQICKDKGVESYPTWVFADGSRLTGEQTLEALAAKTACPLPEGATSQPVSTTSSSAAK